MDTDERLEWAQELQGQAWEARLNATHRSGRLSQWVTSLHPRRLACWLADINLFYGSYNAGCKFSFEDGSAWLLRFPRVGRVHQDYADEKVAVEVAVINLIRQETTIPVPKIETWGVAAQNPLGLGPFIVMEFIDGVSLNDLWKNENGTRLLGDVSDDEVERVYRQFANFLLQLFKLDFDCIGSVGSKRRPLTWKAHDILQTGGVDTFGDRTFSSTTEYFQYVAEQDWQQLVRQPNSAYTQENAMAKYRAFQVIKSLIPDLIHPEYDRTKFKIICDDLGLANLMVKSRQDLTVVGVVDFEWSYIGPAQLFGSAPWWLLMDRPTNPAWDCQVGESTEIGTRYFVCLQIFKRVLEEEEAKMLGSKELSGLVDWSQRSGAMWLHMLLSSGFNGVGTFPFAKLVQHVGLEEWQRRERFVNADEAAAFGDRKVAESKEYIRDMDKIEGYKTLVDQGKMEMEDLVAKLPKVGST